jgi:hypothetical protein
MEVHRSRYGIGAKSARPGRWYIWIGPRLLGYADRNRNMDGPNWHVFEHTDAAAEPRDVGGAHNLDRAIETLLRGLEAELAEAR